MIYRASFLFNRHISVHNLITTGFTSSRAWRGRMANHGEYINIANHPMDQLGYLEIEWTRNALYNVDQMAAISLHNFPPDYRLVTGNIMVAFPCIELFSVPHTCVVRGACCYRILPFADEADMDEEYHEGSSKICTNCIFAWNSFTRSIRADGHSSVLRCKHGPPYVCMSSTTYGHFLFAAASTRTWSETLSLHFVATHPRFKYLTPHFLYSFWNWIMWVCKFSCCAHLQCHSWIVTKLLSVLEWSDTNWIRRSWVFISSISIQAWEIFSGGGQSWTWETWTPN